MKEKDLIPWTLDVAKKLKHGTAALKAQFVGGKNMHVEKININTEEFLNAIEPLDILAGFLVTNLTQIKEDAK